MRVLLSMLLLSLTQPAFAADEVTKEKASQEKLVDTSYEDQLLKDWLGLIKVLRSRGIHNSNVDWRPIEELCLGLKNQKDHVPYNRCRLDKAVSQVTYHRDNDECDEAAVAQYPDRLTQYRPEIIATGNEEDEKGSEFTTNQYYRAPISKRELTSKRRVLYRSCMRDLGWNDPYNWRMGRKD
jgi:hypothetical protein